MDRRDVELVARSIRAYWMTAASVGQHSDGSEQVLTSTLMHSPGDPLTVDLIIPSTTKRTSWTSCSILSTGRFVRRTWRPGTSPTSGMSLSTTAVLIRAHASSRRESAPARRRPCIDCPGTSGTPMRCPPVLISYGRSRRGPRCRSSGSPGGRAGNDRSGEGRI